MPELKIAEVAAEAPLASSIINRKLRLTVPPGILLDFEVTFDEIPIVVTRVAQEFIKAGIITGGTEISIVK